MNFFTIASTQNLQGIPPISLSHLFPSRTPLLFKTDVLQHKMLKNQPINSTGVVFFFFFYTYADLAQKNQAISALQLNLRFPQIKRTLWKKQIY